MCSAMALMVSIPTFAGGILTNTNQNAKVELETISAVAPIKNNFFICFYNFGEQSPLLKYSQPTIGFSKPIAKINQIIYINYLS